jgi:hypothetical protein
MPDIEVCFDLNHAYPVRFTRDAFNPANPVLADVFRHAGATNRIQVVLAGTGHANQQK